MPGMRGARAGRCEMTRYCMECGSILQPISDGRGHWRCLTCGWVYYAQLKVGAAALVEVDGRLLLARRSYDPWRGCWYLPAGYVEVDESPAQAAEREAYEETGLQVRAGLLLDVLYFDDDPRGAGLLVVYACQVLAGQLRNSDETDALVFFDAQQLPESLAGAGHRQMILAWQRSKEGQK